MNKTNSNPFRVAAIFMAIMGVLQIVGLVRYLDRLPEDWIGIGLYILTIIAFVVASFGFYTKGRTEK